MKPFKIRNATIQIQFNVEPLEEKVHRYKTMLCINLRYCWMPTETLIKMGRFNGLKPPIRQQQQLLSFYDFYQNSFIPSIMTNIDI